MERRIIVGFEDNAQGERAIALARLLASAGASRVTVVTVVEESRYVWTQALNDEIESRGQHALARRLDELCPDLHATPRAICGASAAGALHWLAESEDADLLVLGPTHRGPLGKVFIGTTGEQLLHGSPCPVALAPQGSTAAAAGERPLAVAFDGSAESGAALEWAAATALALGRSLRVVGVVEPLPAYPYEHLGPPVPMEGDEELIDQRCRMMRSKIDSTVERHDPPLECERVVLIGHPVNELRDRGADGCELLVVGSRGFGPVKSVLLGSVSAALARSCPVPLVVVPRPDSVPSADRERRASAPA